MQKEKTETMLAWNNNSQVTNSYKREEQYPILDKELSTKRATIQYISQSKISLSPVFTQRPL